VAVIDEKSYERVTRTLRDRLQADRGLLDQLRADVRTSLTNAHRIQPRSTTAISLVGTDGGNNRVQFDPFLAQVVRVVDSSNNEYCLDVITPTSDRESLSRQHVSATGEPLTPLGRMMKYLDVTNLWELSTMIEPPGRDPAPSWVQVYRELTEWAVLFCLVREKNFGTDTVIVCDGLLRSKVFAGELFRTYRAGLDEAIRRQQDESRRAIFIVGVAKHSKVLQQYRLAMALEGVLRTDYPAFVEVSRQLEEKVYKWSEYARGDEREGQGEANKFVAGKMFFVKFGARARDPIWPVDLLISQVGEAPRIMGYLLADATDGFPVPFYPQCLQRAHENAALVDFDMDILQGEIIDSIREILGVEQDILDEMRLMDADPSQRRYSGGGA
jgi:hypothetical protein